jgi:hypothetical protein
MILSIQLEKNFEMESFEDVLANKFGFIMLGLEKRIKSPKKIYSCSFEFLNQLDLDQTQILAPSDFQYNFSSISS